LKMNELFGPSLSVYLWCTHISRCRSNRFDEHRRTGKMIRAIQILGFLLMGPLLAPAQMSFPGDKERERICKELVRRSCGNPCVTARRDRGPCQIEGCACAGPRA